MPSAPDPVRRARAYLVRVAEPPAPALARLVEDHGPVAAADRVATGDVPDSVRNETSARPCEDLDRERLVTEDFAAAARVGARLVTPEDGEWPTQQLAALCRSGEWAPPLALWVRGPARLPDALDGAVGVFGTRAASPYGEHVAADFGHSLATAGHSVVTGLAYGIEAAALRGALAADEESDATTVAVLACGIDVAYPVGNSSLRDRIAERGVLVSEYPPGFRPARHRFTTRHRLLAACATGVVVVEASLRSGARAAATTAAAVGRPVMAVPGPITSTQSQGCHDLLRHRQAILVTSVPDILAVINNNPDCECDSLSSPHRAAGRHV